MTFNQTTNNFYNDQMRSTQDIMHQLKRGKANLKRERFDLPADFVPSPRPVFPNIKNAGTPMGTYEILRKSTKTPKMAMRLEKNKNGTNLTLR